MRAVRMGAIVAAVATALLILILLVFAPRESRCNWCVPTYCAFDVDCPAPNCSCCKQQGRIDGECC